MEKTLLRRIQDSSTDPSADVLSLLRLCKILAARLRNETLAAWVDAELGGYAEDADLPDYRVFIGSCHMSVFNQFRGQATLPVSTAALRMGLEDEDAVRRVYTVRMRDSVAKVAHWLTMEGEPSRDWPAGVVRKVRRFVSEWDAIRGYTSIDRSDLAMVLDAVKTRALSLVLELESEHSQLGEQAPDELPGTSDQRVNQIVTNHITVHGDNAKINAAVSNATVVAGDLDSLQAALAGRGLTESETEALVDIVQEEKTPEGVFQRLKTGAKHLALKATETGVVEAVKSYFA